MRLTCEEILGLQRILIPIGFGSGLLPIFAYPPNHTCFDDEIDNVNSSAQTVNVTNGNSSSNFTTTAVEIGIHFSYLIIIYTLLVLITVIGNIFVIVAFLKETSLQAVTNYWIISLSLTDIILATTVMPIGILVELSDGYWLLGTECCRMYIALDVLCCTCSIYHLALISLDRYFCVRYPFTYPQQRSKKSALLAILITWLLCLIISLPPLVGWDNLEGLELECKMTSNAYMITSSILSFYFPLLLIICMYVGIYRATNRHSSKFLGSSSSRTANSPATANRQPNDQTSIDKSENNKGVESCSIVNRSLSNERSTAVVTNGIRPRKRLEEIGLSTIRPRLKTIAEGRRTSRLLETFAKSPVINTLKTRLIRSSKTPARNEVPPGLIRHSIPTVAASANLIPLLEMTARSRLFSMPIGLHPDYLGDEESHYEMSKSIPISSNGDENANTMKAGGHADIICSPSQLHRSTSDGSDRSTTSSELRVAKSLAKLPGLRLAPGAKAPRCQNTSTRFHRTRLKQERRAARIVVMILTVFILFWTPFFVVNIVEPVCPQCQISPNVWKLVTWTGYANSAVNPFIYTCKHSQMELL